MKPSGETRKIEIEKLTANIALLQWLVYRRTSMDEMKKMIKQYTEKLTKLSRHLGTL